MNFKIINLLLIDDDEDEFINLRDLIGEIKGTTYNLKWIPSYDDGLKALQTTKYDACLLDHRLGKHTGLDLLRAVIDGDEERASEPARHALRFLAASRKLLILPT